MQHNITNHYIEAIKQIKQAILSSRYRAAALVNREMLSLYFGIGGLFLPIRVKVLGVRMS